MSRLSSQQVLKDNNTDDPSSITNLKLTHKALSDVSCLGEFKNLERLDLSFNNLTSLEGLKACVNLKWLSVVQNKLQSLKGVEGLSRLTVLNAGKNKLKSVEEVKSLLNLRALILNDNEIGSICRLDELKELNTLVLSRNPVRKIGESLVKIKSITKLSLSNCQLQTVGSSLKSCLELKELRLAHNDIKAIPVELALNTKLQNLDLGNNVITSWSDLKVLSSLVNLTNLNLQGNPIAEKDKLAKKIQKALPGLHIFNSKPLEKFLKHEKNDGAKETDQVQLEDDTTSKKKYKRKTDSELGQKEECEYDGEEGKRKKHKRNEKQSVKENSTNKGEKNPVEKLNGDKKKSEQGELDIIDDGDTSFAELLNVGRVPKYLSESNRDNKAARELDPASGLFIQANKRKKNKSSGMKSSGVEMLSSTLEVGMGGPSAWDDA